MKLPTWFKVLWWIIITALTAWLFSSRIPAILQGNSAPVDVFVFLVLVALMLTPIFQEVSFFGLKFKQSIDELQKQISTQLAVFKSEIQTTISSSNNFNVTLSPPAPSDDRLPELETRIRAAVSEAMQEEGMAYRANRQSSLPKVDDDTIFLFQTRYTIERKLRNISSSFANMPDRRFIPIIQLTSLLMKQELLHPNIANAIREVYSVCSPAIHGEPVTVAQVNFVRDVTPQIIEALTEIERRTTPSTQTRD